MLNEPSKVPNISPIRYAQWAFDSLATEITPHLQILRQSQNLTPEELLCAHKSLMNIYGTQAQIHNLAELFGEGDRVSALKYCSYNAKQFLDAVINQVKKTVDTNKIHLFANVRDDVKTIILDARRTSLILYNLISNSIIHTKPKEKHINIYCRIENDNLILTVNDNGGGIPMTKRKHLFTAFEDGILPSALTRTGAGYTLSGLGLSVSQKAAADMKGYIRYVPSREVTQFEVCIPQTGLDRTNVSETITFIPDVELMTRCLATAKLFLASEKV